MTTVTTYSVAGCKLSIASAPLDPQDTDFTNTDFSSLTWTEIKNWTEMGLTGDAIQLITTQIIGTGRDAMAAGNKNGGSMQNTFALLPTDAGQAALIAALGKNYPIKVEYNDKPSAGASPKNSLRYFVGLILTAQETGGGSNTVRNLTANIAINSNVVRIAASAT